MVIVIEIGSDLMRQNLMITLDLSSTRNLCMDVFNLCRTALAHAELTVNSDF